MRNFALLTGTVALVCCSSAAVARRAGGTITGIVRDTAGKPLPAANVSLHPGDRRTQTDSSGRFSIEGLGEDTYTVRARKLGYRPDSWDVKISSSGRADVKLSRSIRSRHSGCINAVVDGRPASPAYPIPETAGRLAALEIYTRPDSVPKELREFLWPKSGGLARTGRCTVIVYWTNRGLLEISRSTNP